MSAPGSSQRPPGNRVSLRRPHRPAPSAAGRSGRAPLRILIADNHEIVRRGLRVLLETQPDWTICGDASTGIEAVTMAREQQPDIVLLDFELPGLNGLEATRQIRQSLPGAQILILTWNQSEPLVRAIAASGANGLVPKSDAWTLLIQALKQLRRHRSYFPTRIADRIRGATLNWGGESVEAQRSTRLTPREREVIQLIAGGKSSKEVGDALGISTKTAETHRANLMRKLELHSVSELVRYAIRHQIIEA